MDNRSYHRFKIDERAIVVIDGKDYPCSVKNLSEGGFCLEFDEDVPSVFSGEHIDFQIVDDDLDWYVTSRAVVRWIEHGKVMKAGCMFTGRSHELYRYVIIKYTKVVVSARKVM